MSKEFRVRPPGYATKAIHVSQDPEQWNSMAVVPPITTSTIFKQDGPGEHRGFEHGRKGNPTRNILESCLASLENGKHGLCYASGMGALTSICSLLKSGDHLICGDDVYGFTSRYFREILPKMGIETEFVDATDSINIKNAIKGNTRMVWLESPTNPLLNVVDIQNISEIAHGFSSKIIVVVDNTFLTSYFQRPLELGADIVMYSLTKYINGHADVIMGAAITNNDEHHERLRFLQNAMGIVPSPFDCYQVNRSLKTLALRMEQHSKNSIVVAKFLENHPSILKVMHPGLPSHPKHQLALKQCYGHSGMMSFYLDGGIQEATKLLKRMKIITLAGSLGGDRSLAEMPFILSHASLPAEDKQRLGITDNLIRLSVGLENVEDIVADLEQALMF